MYRLYGLLMIMCVVFCVLAMSAALLIGRQSDADVLAYVMLSDTGDQDIWLLEYPSRRTFPIAFRSSELEYDPAWSTDGQLAYIQRWLSGRYEVSCNVRVEGYVINPQPFSECIGLVWSQDGRLAFSARRNQYRDIYVWNGIELLNWTNSIEDEISPTWSPDGRLAFVSNLEGNYEIYVENTEGIINVSQDQMGNYSPTWSHNGRLAFVFGRTEGAPFDSDIALWDGTQITHITQNGDNNENPQWDDDGYLIFSTGEYSRDLHVWNGRNESLLFSTPYTITSYTPWLDGVTFVEMGMRTNIFIWNEHTTEQLTYHDNFDISYLAWMPRNR
jgi:Tol biopolymer transport system component